MENNEIFLRITTEKIEEIYQRYSIDCNENPELDISRFWNEVKTSIKGVANAVMKQMKEDEEKKIISLEVKYLMLLMEDSDDGKIHKVKRQLNETYNIRSKKRIDKMRGLVIQDHVYDIKKLQRKKKI